jgi:hypothetical protein
MHVQLDVPFRGKRDYLHSTDVYRAVVDHLATRFSLTDIVSFRIKFNLFSHAVLDLHYWAEGDTAPEMNAAKGFIWFELSDKRRFRGYFADSDRPAERRIEGHEPAILAATRTESTWASVMPMPGADAIEHVVFATKKIHTQRIPLQEGLWIVGELRSAGVLDRELSGAVRIEMQNNRADKITQSSIHIGPEEFGSIIFMVAR